jgi:hypothetical protein
MEAAALREALHAQPFRPFTLRLADGCEVPVPHPDFVAVAPNGRRVAVFHPTDDSMSILEPLLIVTLEYAASGQSAPPSGNGT